ncbi:MAG TPA: cytochrome c oxidase assembly protein [Gemmatimonadaceae bacterium]
MRLFALLDHPFSQSSWLTWSIHPSTVIGLVALGALYLWRLRQAKGDEHASVVRRISFLAALLVIFASLNGPIHDLSDTYLFSAHMVQHLMLTMLMPPLLIAGVPGWMLRPLLRSRAIASIARVVTRPVACFAIFNIVIAMWHLPVFYNAAMDNHNIHILEHLMFMAAAVLMWWPLTSQLPELPRLSYPGQMLYCFLMIMPMSIVAVYISMADRVLYPAYAAAPRITSLSPLEDQLLGGLIMWVPGGMIFMIIMSVIFFKWAARGGDDAASAQVDWKPRAA